MNRGGHRYFFQDRQTAMTWANTLNADFPGMPVRLSLLIAKPGNQLFLMKKYKKLQQKYHTRVRTCERRLYSEHVHTDVCINGVCSH
jgi:hypothetical protein